MHRHEWNDVSNGGIEGWTAGGVSVSNSAGADGRLCVSTATAGCFSSVWRESVTRSSRTTALHRPDEGVGTADR